MPVINSIVNWLNIKRIYSIDLFMQYPYNVQKETFTKLISFASETQWGQKYGYHEDLSIEEYQKTVPIQSYDEIKSYVERLRDGQQNILWPTEIKWFAKSSGTTCSWRKTSD